MGDDKNGGGIRIRQGRKGQPVGNRQRPTPLSSSMIFVVIKRRNSCLHDIRIALRIISRIKFRRARPSDCFTDTHVMKHRVDILRYFRRIILNIKDLRPPHDFSARLGFNFIRGQRKTGIGQGQPMKSRRPLKSCSHIEGPQEISVKSRIGARTDPPAHFCVMGDRIHKSRAPHGGPIEFQIYESAELQKISETRFQFNPVHCRPTSTYPTWPVNLSPQPSPGGLGQEPRARNTQSPLDRTARMLKERSQHLYL